MWLDMGIKSRIMAVSARNSEQ